MAKISYSRLCKRLVREKDSGFVKTAKGHVLTLDGCLINYIADSTVQFGAEKAYQAIVVFKGGHPIHGTNERVIDVREELEFNMYREVSCYSGAVLK